MLNETEPESFGMEDEPQPETDVKLPQFLPQFTFGNAIQLIILIVGGTFFFASLGSQIHDVQLGLDQTNHTVADIRTEVTNLPTETAQIVVLQQHAAQTDTAISTINAEIRELTNEAIQNKADIENIERASSMQLRHK